MNNLTYITHYWTNSFDDVAKQIMLASHEHNTVYLITLSVQSSLAVRQQGLTSSHANVTYWSVCIYACFCVFMCIVRMSVYLSCEVKGWGLGNCTVHLPEHLTQLRHHGSKIVEESLHWLLKDGAHRLSYIWEHKCHHIRGRGPISKNAQVQQNVTYLYNLGVIQPLAEDSLNESKHLLQNHHYL